MVTAKLLCFTTPANRSVNKQEGFQTMTKLVIKSDDEGLGLFKDGQPWSYYQHGDDIFALLSRVVPEFTEVEHQGRMTEEESETFC
jgi:hypothetical protein